MKASMTFMMSLASRVETLTEAVKVLAIKMRHESSVMRRAVTRREAA